MYWSRDRAASYYTIRGAGHETILYYTPKSERLSERNWNALRERNVSAPLERWTEAGVNYSRRTAKNCISARIRVGLGPGLGYIILCGS
jgi:hypothetical protein